MRQDNDFLDLKDEDPVVIGLMIDYFYQMDYDDALPSRRAAEVRNEAARIASLTASCLAIEDSPTDAVQLQELENGSSSAYLKKKKKKYRVRDVEPEPHWVPEISYHEPEDITFLDAEKLPVNALMYALAEKYDIDHLKTLAMAKFEGAASESLWAPAFARAAHLVFTTTASSDEGLRNIVVSTLSQHRELIDYEGIASLIKTGNEIGWALIQMLK